MNTLTNNKARINCLIIDDDPFIQDLLLDKLNQHFPDLSVLDVASSGMEGLSKIEKFNPELIFLDVEMNDMTGFEMLSQVKSINFKTIFITSYKHYAIKAIRFNALDYLLKPFDLEELKAAIGRFKRSTSSNKMHTALKNLRSKHVSEQILVLNTQQGEKHLEIKDIIQIDGDRNYSNIYLTNNRKELVSKNLSQLEELLEDKGFFRCHKSHLINRFHIKIKKRFKVIMTNDTTVPVSRRKIKPFDQWYSQPLKVSC